MPNTLRSIATRCLLCIPLLALPLPGYALVISFVDTGGAAPGSDMEKAFQSAARLWTSSFSDQVTLKFNIGFAVLVGTNAGALAEADAMKIDVPYAAVQQALTNDKRTADDIRAVSVLPSGPSLEFFTTDKSGTRVKDADGSINNSTLRVTRPNAKALGLLGADAAVDGSIRFNKTFEAQLDFDRTDGIAAGKYDVVGLAAHEIGHALGFLSGVDAVDWYSLPNGGGAPYDLNATPTLSVLDLYRYTQDSAAAGHLLDIAVGGEPYFSLDTGMTSLGRFANGAFNGTGGDPNGAGNQASHWWDVTPSIGLMDPTSEPFGKIWPMTALDVVAFDVIGWDRVPEPGILVLLAIGALAAVAQPRARRAARSAHLQ